MIELEDPSQLEHVGDHSIDEIYEVPPPGTRPPGELPTPADIN